MQSDMEKRSGEDRRKAQRRKHERIEPGFVDRRKGDRRDTPERRA